MKNKTFQGIIGTASSSGAPSGKSDAPHPATPGGQEDGEEGDDGEKDGE